MWTTAIPGYVNSNGMLFAPRVLFPLSRDHLTPLIEYNIYRATWTNISILGLFESVTGSCGYKTVDLPLFPFPRTGSIPPALLPTRLQKSTPHPTFIDIIPSPTMHGNAIRLGSDFDYKDFAADVMGGVVSRPTSIRGGAMVWLSPWEASGWEMTEALVRKWPTLFKGCDDMLDATNRWRVSRDEEPLVWELE